MAIDVVQAIHSSAAAQNIAAVDSAQRSQSAQGQAAGVPQSSVPQDKVTISPAAQAKQAAAAGDRDHDGDSK